MDDETGIPFGDAVTDARMYEAGRRMDKNRAGDNDSIALLNARAMLSATKKDKMPEEVESAWRRYVMVLEEHWGQRPTTKPDAPLGRAYYHFWNALSQHR
ncbi:MAG: hypothetical protein M1816_008018 [Peltula sp. TS41687]|nr:MAG: hypothetical protein M1816_008018 [Peltula sp. TS41687]